MFQISHKNGWNIQERSRISRDDEEKIMWNFNHPGILIFGLGIPIMGVKNICRISEDEALFYKSRNSKGFREPQQITFIKINRFCPLSKNLPTPCSF